MHPKITQSHIVAAESAFSRRPAPIFASKLTRTQDWTHVASNAGGSGNSAELDLLRDVDRSRPLV